VVTFCRRLQKLLEDPRLGSRPVVYYTDTDIESQTNAAFLLGAYLVLMLGWSPDDAAAPFERVQPSPFRPFRDVNPPAQTRPPATPHPNPQIPNPKTQAPNPQPPNPGLSTLKPDSTPQTLNTKPETRNPNTETRNPRPSRPEPGNRSAQRLRPDNPRLSAVLPPHVPLHGNPRECGARFQAFGGCALGLFGGGTCVCANRSVTGGWRGGSMPDGSTSRRLTWSSSSATTARG